MSQIELKNYLLHWCCSFETAGNHTIRDNFIILVGSSSLFFDLLDLLVFALCTLLKFF